VKRRWLARDFAFKIGLYQVFSLLFEGVWFLRKSRNPDVELRLGEINRRSRELGATSSKLEKMILQLDQLRKTNARIALLDHRSNGPSCKLDRKVAGNWRNWS
jgi:hypothetical protein